MGIVRKNVIANYLGQGWSALMALAFVPLYIKYLGMEAYGLIGIFALLQAWMVLLDMGMTPALSREMARFTGGARDAQSTRDLLRSVEVMAFGVAVVIALGIWVVSRWLASDWLRAEKLPVDDVARAFTVMGVVTALRFVENIYRSAIGGLQRQVMLNVIMSIMATVRGLGAVGILVWVSPTIDAFFVWQGILSIVTVGIFAAFLHHALPPVERTARFSLTALKGIRKFAAGMMTITFLALLLTQVDKILLSRLLTLEAFGYYALAGTVANALYVLPGPVSTAFYPRLTELMARADGAGLINAYHKGAQLVTVLMGAAAIVLIVFGDVVMTLWTADHALARQVSPLVAVLALGTLLNGLMWIPYQTQLAHGWTSLGVKVNVVAVAAIVPAILWATPKYGAIGAAWVWVALNAGYVTIAISLMHRRLLTTEKWRWYQEDVAMPLLAGAAVAVLLRWAMPVFSGSWAQLTALSISGILVLAAAALAAQTLRRQLVCFLPRKLRSFCVRTV
ncbi:MAG: oligosaccharide flippase family protein [Deltaproteobacteria bacterium]|nr:oligosaccharide flippase family protein [Deltaproteobacteria bacterium]